VRFCVARLRVEGFKGTPRRGSTQDYRVSDSFEALDLAGFCHLNLYCVAAKGLKPPPMAGLAQRPNDGRENPARESGARIRRENPARESGARIRREKVLVPHWYIKVSTAHLYN
jgi:hypothetical protein